MASEIQKQVIRDTFKRVYVMGSNSPTPMGSIFSGSDIIGFFDGDLPELMSYKLSTNSLECVFILSKSTTKLIFKKDWIDFNIIGATECGGKGLISGECRVNDFKMGSSIDELSNEITIYFGSEIKEIRGWTGGSKEDNDYIKEVYTTLIEGFRNGK